MSEEIAVPPVKPPEFDYNEHHIELAKKDFADYSNCMMTKIWNARDRLLLKGSVWRGCESNALCKGRSIIVHLPRWAKSSPDVVDLCCVPG